MSRFDGREPMRGGSPEQNKERLQAELHRAVESIPETFVRKEISATVQIMGRDVRVYGTIYGGTPLVRTWSATVNNACIRTDTFVSAGLAIGSGDQFRISDWNQVLKEFGSPTSIVTGRGQAEVVWRMNQGELKAVVMTEQLVEAEVPFEVVSSISEDVYDHDIFADMAFEGVGTLRHVKLGNSEYFYDRGIVQASFSKIGAQIQDPRTRDELIALLKSGRKERSIHVLEKKLKLAEAFLRGGISGTFLRDVEAINRAHTIKTRFTATHGQEEVMGHRWGESWGTGRYADVTYRDSFLDCDGTEVRLPDTDKPLGGAFSYTLDAVIRDFLLLRLEQIEKEVEVFQKNMREIRTSYAVPCDPIIYGDFDAEKRSPEEEPLREALRRLLFRISLRFERAHAAADRGLEKRNPEAAKEKAGILEQYKQRWEQAEALLADKGFRSHIVTEPHETRRQLERWMTQALRAVKDKNYLGAVENIEEIGPALEEIEQFIEGVKRVRAEYHERKAELHQQALALQARVRDLVGTIPYGAVLSRTLLDQIDRTVRNGLVPAKNRVMDYEHWISQTEDLIEKIKKAVERAQEEREQEQQERQERRERENAALRQQEEERARSMTRMKEEDSGAFAPLTRVEDRFMDAEPPTPVSPGLAASFADRFHSRPEKKQQPPQPVPISVQRYVAPEEKKEEITEEMRAQYAAELAAGKAVLQGLKNLIPPNKSGTKLSTIEVNHQKLRAMLLDRVTKIGEIEHELPTILFVDRAKGKVGDVMRQVDRAVEEAVRVMGGARYEQILGMIPDIETEWGAALSQFSRRALTPALLALAGRGESVEKMQKQLSDLIGEELVKG